MRRTYSFAFLDNSLQKRLIARVRQHNIPHSIDERMVIHYPSTIELVMGNQIISSIRSEVFPTWQTLSFPRGWAARYRGYLHRRRIPYREEISNGRLGLLIPGNYRPHQWKNI